MLSGRSRTLIDLATTVVIIATCGVLVWANRTRIWPPAPPTPPVPEAPISIEGVPTLGDPAASVVIVMYTDYECPYCARFERETLSVLVREYIETGKVRLVVRHHPLEAIHPLAFDAAVAATCADRQGKFWAMHERLFEQQREIGPAVIEEIASGVGLDRPAFTACAASEDATAQVRGDVESAVAAGLMGTPAFLIGVAEPGGSVKVTAVVNGARPAAEFAETLDALISGARAATRWTARSLIVLAAIAGSLVWLGRQRLTGWMRTGVG